MRKTKIVCTIGPASESKEKLTELCLAGMDVARLNFSHGTHEEHLARINTIREVEQETGRMIAIMLDTKGPEVRLGKFKGGEAEIKAGDVFTLTTREIEGDNTISHITYQQLPKRAEAGMRVLIADGIIELNVVRVLNETDVLCKVVDGGVLGNRKNVNIPGATADLPALTAQDIDDLNFGIDHAVDMIAASFIRRPVDIFEIRKVLDGRDAGHIKIIAKIESRDGIENCEDILKIADGIMVARGDMGVELPTEELPMIQKRMIHQCNVLGKPVITATQMLDSMIRNPRPTRAEVTDVANAIIDGTDAIMLSGETAAGKHPVESVEMMAKIAVQAETQLTYGKELKRNANETITVTDAISHAACVTSMELKTKAIITPTQLGSTARDVAKFRPLAPVIAVTPYEHTARPLALSFGVYPMVLPSSDSTDALIDAAVNLALEKNFIENGDLVVITAGVPVGISGSTNLIKIHIAGEILAKAMGMGNGAAVGRICFVRDVGEAMTRFEQGDVLVAEHTDAGTMPLIEKASALVVEEGGLTSHAAIVGLNLKKPVIVGVQNVFSKFRDGQIVTVDAKTGVVYNGKAKTFLES